MATCPNGHESTWDDYCSDCGTAMSTLIAAPDPANVAPESAVAATPPVSPDGGLPTPVPIGPACPNCSAAHDPADVFCENCGYDFASGTLPESEAVSPTGASVGVPAPALVASPVVAVVSFDRSYFERAVEPGQLTYPGPEPLERRVELSGAKVLVGRHSKSRGVYPEIDLRAITDDPAVSHRHVMFIRADDGSWSLNDLGSTNGTYVGADEDPVAAGADIALPLGTPVYVGAWTRIVLEQPQ